MQLRFTTFVVITMKSPHILSTVHDLAICTRSAQSSQKEDFITTTQTAVSQYLHQRYVQISILGQASPLLHERARCDTSTRVSCLLSNASSDSSSYTSARSTHSSHHVSDTCTDLQRTFSTSAPVVQLSRQIQESATSVSPSRPRHRKICPFLGNCQCK